MSRLAGPWAEPVVCGPETSVVETAAILGLAVHRSDALATLDVGRWRGLAPEEIDPAELRAWFVDADARPHGGESIRAFVTRIGEAAGAVDAGTLVVASPVAQALLCSGPDSYFAVDVASASMLALP